MANQTYEQRVDMFYKAFQRMLATRRRLWMEVAEHRHQMTLNEQERQDLEMALRTIAAYADDPQAFLRACDLNEV